MVLIALLIGSIIIVAALRNSQGALFSALATDVPQFVVWGAAILALGAIGWVPDLKPISRGLLALIIIVIVLRNYKGILGGFQAVATGASSGAATGAGASSPTLSATTAPLPLPIASAGGSSGGTTPAQAISPYGTIGGVGAGLPSFGVPSWSYSGLEDMLNPTSVIEGTNGSN